MAKHCTFRCGGNAELYVIPGNVEELTEVIKTCCQENYPYMVIGNGSNILVRDEGYKGAIIEVNSRINDIDVIGDEIVADAGAKLSAVAMTAYENDLAGFEFAHGIPGNVGGAVVMNAGAYGGEMKDVIKWVKVLDEEGNIVTLNNEELEFPSAGSTFKRPEGYFAGKLIDDAGLRGYRVGGAMVSEKHCGFVINYDNATATDVLNLIEDVQKKVKEKFDVELETEVKLI